MYVDQNKPNLIYQQFVENREKRSSRNMRNQRCRQNVFGGQIQLDELWRHKGSANQFTDQIESNDDVTAGHPRTQVFLRHGKED